MLGNRCVLQQQHVDCKIADALLKKGTKQPADGWDAPSKAWAHMVLHLPHAEGGFGVTFNDVTKDAAFYTTTSRFVAWLGSFSHGRQGLWLPKDDLQDSSSWSSSPLLLLRDIHSKLLTKYNCKEGCAPSQSQAHVGARGGLSSQDGVSQQQQDAPLSIPQLNHLHEASIVWGEDASNVAVTAIPAQNRLTHQILHHFQEFKDLKETFAVSRRAEQLCLRTKQRVVATVEESVLRTEMENFELSWLVTSRVGLVTSAAGPVPLVLDLRITHERFGSSSDPSINGHVHYPNDLDGPLNEAAADKIRAYRTALSI